ncbi:MAG TPA: HNH endonuclease [Acidimicrobiales bacterium]|nr:HNH endonuclease [Acidimicrobiales bacterium]
MWVKTSDQFHKHPKARAAGKEARALWRGALEEVNASNDGKGSGGVVTEVILRDAAYFEEIDNVDETAKRLVKVGLWHTAAGIKKCTSEYCQQFLAGGGKIGPGEYYFHDYYEWQLTTDQSKIPIARMRANRAKALTRWRERCQEILERDGTLCRYCGRRVNFLDKRGALGGTYDHVDPDKFAPDGGNALADVVVACRECNGRKGDRTPEEAGMALLPPGTTALSLVSDPYGSDPDLTPAKNGPSPGLTGTEPDLASRARHARDSGHRSGRAKSGPGSGQVGDGSGAGLSGPGGAGDGAVAGSGAGSGPGPVSAETEFDDREVS